MCQFGDESKIIEELNLPIESALIGFRGNYITNLSNNREKFLKSLKIEYLWKKNQFERTNLNRNSSSGYYNYNNYHNYDYYDYNNYYYNNNYYNHNYDNNYYNNNNYYVAVKTKLWGKIFKYEEGYRSEYCYPTHLIILDKDSKWFSDRKTIEFANHFNQTVENLAKEYNCEVMEFKEYSK